MSLYYVQKFLYQLNRDPTLQGAYRTDPHGCLDGYDLTDEEIAALVEPDIGLLFHLGVNGQILMHFAAFHGVEWSDYLQRMRDGIERHGPVREGVYAMVGYEGVTAHSSRLGQPGTRERLDPPPGEVDDSSGGGGESAGGDSSGGGGESAGGDSSGGEATGEGRE